MSLTTQPVTTFESQSPLDGGSPGRQSTAENKIAGRAKMLAKLGLFGISLVVGFYALGPIALYAMGESDALKHADRIGKFARAHPGLLKPVANAVTNVPINSQREPEPLGTPVAENEFAMHPDAIVSSDNTKVPISSLSTAKEMISDAIVSEQVGELRTQLESLRQQITLEQMQVEELEKKFEYMEAQTDEPAQVRAPAKASLMQVLMSLVMWVSTSVGAKAIYKLVAKPAPAPARCPAVTMFAAQPLRRYPVNQSRCRTPITAVMMVARQDKQEGKRNAVARSAGLTMTTGAEPDVDIYRDTVLRYAGYLSEVGEAFRPLVSVYVVYLSYALALYYVAADSFSKGLKTASLPVNQGIKGCGIAAVIDTLTFQLLASIIFPSFVINRTVAFILYLEEQFGAISKMQGAFGASNPDQVLVSFGGLVLTPGMIGETFPTYVGLLLIPALVKPIDGIVEQILDNFVRPLLNNTFAECTLPFCDREACDLSDGTGFGGGEAVRNPELTEINPNDPKRKRQAMDTADSLEEEYMKKRQAAERIGDSFISGGMGFGGGEATRDPPTDTDPTALKANQQAIRKADSFEEYLKNRQTADRGGDRFMNDGEVSGDLQSGDDFTSRGKGFGGGKATRDPEPAAIDPNGPTAERKDEDDGTREGLDAPVLDAGTRIMRSLAKLQELEEAGQERTQSYWRARGEIAQALLDEGEKEQALACQQNLLDEISLPRTDPVVVEGYTRLAVILGEMGEYEKAMNIINDNIQAFDQNSEQQTIRNADGLEAYLKNRQAADRSTDIVMSDGKVFGGGEDSPDPEPTVIDSNDPKTEPQVLDAGTRFRRAIAKVLELKGAGQEQTDRYWRVRGEIAQALFDDGKRDYALACQQNLLEEMGLPRNDPVVIEGYTLLALMFGDRGEHDKALKIIKDNIEAHRRGSMAEQSP